MEGIIYPAAVMGGLGLLFGTLLAFASKKFFVETDPRQNSIRELLPGANCGGCGYPGCDGYAEAIVKGEAKPNLCGAGGTTMVEKISEIMGVAAETEEPNVAFLKCSGSPDKRVKHCVYLGVHDCREAAVVPGKGPNACQYGCLGLGTCVDVCMFGAMSMKNSLPVIDFEKCVGCGMCVSQCPRNVLTLVPRSAKVTVACNSPLKGPFVKQVCSAGCIGCTLCVRTCPVDAIEMQGSLAVIDPKKCISCGQCAKKCPAKCIVDSRTPVKTEKELKESKVPVEAR